MFDIFYKGNVVATANSFEDAKVEATIYRRRNKITNWKDVTFKKRKTTRILTYFGDDGCCDAARDRRAEIYGCGR